MDVSCPACGARYIADEEKLRGKTARMRCKACSTAWLVAGPGTRSHAASVVSTPPPASIVPVPSGGDVAARANLGATLTSKGTDAPRAGDIKATLPPPSFGFGAGTRNEDSVLFRVDQIPGAARFNAPPAVAPSSTPSLSQSNDDGVIDLKSLSQAPPALRPVPMVVAPLFSEPPPAVAVDVGPSSARPTSKLGLLAGFAVAAVALMGVGLGVAYAFKGEEPVKHTPAAVAPPPQVTPPPKPPEPAPAASASEEDAKDKDAKETKGKKGKRGRGKGKGVITDKTPPPVAKTVKPADPCGCKGNFDCILACTAKGGK